MFKKTALSVLLTLGFAAALAAEVIPVGRSRNGYPLIVPQPQQLEAAEGSFPLPAELTVAAPENFDFAPLGKFYAKTVKGGKVVPAADPAQALCRFELVTEGVPKSVEGYTLAVASDGITVKARDIRGLFYGMQTIKWMIRNREGAGLKACRITDWPDLEMRGLFFELPKIPRQKVDRLCEVIDILGELKYNMILIEFAQNFPLSNYPYTKHKDTFTREDVAKIMAAAKRNHIELVPKLQVASHTQWMTDHPQWEKLSEGKAAIPWDSIYCLSNPDAQLLVEQVVRETADVIKPRYFHLGLDEMSNCGFPKCPKCKAAKPDELLLRHVAPLKKILNDRGITPIIYQDQFFPGTDPKTQPLTPLQRFPEKLGKDVMINSWEYAAVPSPQVGESILKRGFKDLIYMSYSIRPDNCQRLPQIAHRLKAKGNILAYWYAVPATMDTPNLSNVASYPSTLVQANYSWNAGDIDFNLIPIDSAVIMREIANGVPGHLFRGKAVPVPISGIFDQALGEDPQFPRFNEKIAAEVKHLAAADRAKFDVAVRGDKVLAAVLSGGPEDGYRTTSVTIPVGTTATGASFLVAASICNSFALPNPASRVDIGTIKIVYAEGKPMTVPLTLRNNLNDWNSYIGGNNCRVVLRGNDVCGTLFSLYAVDWRNLRPKNVIKEIVVTSKPGSSVSAIALFAVSLSTPSKAPVGAPAPAPEKFAAPQRPLPKLTPVVGFESGIPPHAAVCGSFIPGFRHAVSEIPGHGNVLEFFVPATERFRARCHVDLPIGKVPDNFKYLIFDVQVSDFNSIHRADVYFMDSCISGSQRALGALGYSPALDDGWHKACIPRERFTEKEHGGVTPSEAKFLRIGFFLKYPIRPLTIRIGGVYLSDQSVIGRLNFKLPVK